MGGNPVSPRHPVCGRFCCNVPVLSTLAAHVATREFPGCAVWHDDGVFKTTATLLEGPLREEAAAPNGSPHRNASSVFGRTAAQGDNQNCHSGSFGPCANGWWLASCRKLIHLDVWELSSKPHACPNLERVACECETSSSCRAVAARLAVPRVFAFQTLLSGSVGTYGSLLEWCCGGGEGDAVAPPSVRPSASADGFQTSEDGTALHVHAAARSSPEYRFLNALSPACAAQREPLFDSTQC